MELFLIALVSEKQACCSPKNYLRASLDRPRPLFKCPHIWLASGVLIHWNYAELNAWGTFCPSLQWHANVFIMQKLRNILLNWVFLLLGRDSRKIFVKNITTHSVASEKMLLWISRLSLSINDFSLSMIFSGKKKFTTKCIS